MGRSFSGWNLTEGTRVAGRNRIQLVCFDLGRVLMRICNNWRHACQIAGVAAPSGDPDAAALAALDAAVCRSEVGEIDLDEFAAAAARALGLTPASVVTLSNAYCLGPYPGAGELLDELSAAGVMTACLSNTNANHWRILTDPDGDHGRVTGRLNHRFASHLVRVRKPDARIYAHVEDAVGVSGDAIVFFDDLKENTAAAARRGWHGHWVDPSLDDPIGQIRHHLREHWILA
jgi:putative hydrolase of the HAD superfamily